MIIVKIIGGLGNQMFQYAYAKALEQSGYKVKIDITAFQTYILHGGYQLDKYKIDLEPSTIEENSKFYKNSIIYKILRKFGVKNSKNIEEKSLLFHKDLLNIESDNYIDGYFQSEKYFKDIRKTLIDQFIINHEILAYTKKIEKKITTSENSCALHIRRGDFTNSTNTTIHGTCDIKYYKKATKLLEDKFGKMIYFVFSDDIKWAKANLKNENTIFIETEQPRMPHEDLYLMGLCEHNIIANSSFSWWGAWLNKNEKKIVIAPKRWFADEKLEKESTDIVCENWIKL
jgi:hypothetical protein